MTKYIHDKVIRAWLDGKTVQIYTTKWVDIESVYDDVQLPGFSMDVKYRIKPEAMKYRLAVCYNIEEGHYVDVVYDPDVAMRVQESTDFRKWIGDWQEVEV